jgi:predicted transposase YbfD/YdcC
MSCDSLIIGRRLRWGKRLSREALASIGISRGRVPAPSVWCELFQALDVTSLERILGAWVQGGRAAGHVAIDGKRLRGSATALSPGAHLVAAFSASLEGVIGQLRMEPETNEVTAALQLLKTLPLQDVIVTGDAMFTQREICCVIKDGGGDYFFTAGPRGFTKHRVDGHSSSGLQTRRGLRALRRTPAERHRGRLQPENRMTLAMAAVTRHGRLSVRTHRQRARVLPMTAASGDCNRLSPCGTGASDAVMDRPREPAK